MQLQDYPLAEEASAAAQERQVQCSFSMQRPQPRKRDEVMGLCHLLPSTSRNAVTVFTDGISHLVAGDKPLHFPDAGERPQGPKAYHSPSQLWAA